MSSFPRRVLRFVWRFGWIVCLPAIALSIFAFTRGYRHFVIFGIERSTVPYVLSLDECIREAGARLLRKSLLSLGAAPEPGMRHVHIEGAPGALASLDTDPPYTGRETITASLWIAGVADPVTARDVEVRRHGDTYGHWGRAKRSLRVHTQAADVVFGMRTFSLIAPELDAQLENQLGYRFAREIGLLAPSDEFVHLTLDGTYAGVFEMTERVDEGFLRRRGRIPGPIFSGDLIGRDAWTGIPNELFTNAALWSVQGGKDRAPLEELVDLVSRPLDEARATRLAALLDLRAFARFSLFVALTQSNHVDEFHNWKLYWNTWRRCFEPIAWDPNGWVESMCPPEGTPLDVHPTFSPLEDRLHSLLPFLLARDAEWHAFFARNGDTALLAALDEVRLATHSAFAADPQRVPVDDATWQRAIDALIARAHRIAEGVKAALVDPPAALEWRPASAAEDPLRLRIASIRPVRRLVIGLRGPARPARVALAAGIGRPEIALDARVHGTASGIAIDCPLAAELGTHVEFRPPETARNHRRLPRPTTWDLRMTGIDMRDVLEVAAEDGRSFVARVDLEPDPARELFLAGALDVPPPVTLSGTIEIQGVERWYGRVTVLPGTTFRLAPAASLEFLGGIDARGQAALPIRFVRAEPERAFGVVRIHGERSAGSRLLECRFEGGSSARLDATECSGMLSIHGVPSLTLEKVLVRGATGADDAIHIACSDVACLDLSVEDAVSDGLDVDAATLTITRGRFARCGNDGIDLMSSRAILADIVCSDCEDKGLSIGEGSLALVAGATIERCTTGIESRDGSCTAVLHSSIRGGSPALRACVKDPRYDAGGRLEVFRSTLVECLALGTVDARSALDLTDSRIAGSDRGSASSMVMAACNDSDRCTLAVPLLPAPLHALGERAAELWQAQLHAKRGPRELPAGDGR